MKLIASFLFILLLFLQAKFWFGAHGMFQFWSVQRSIAESNVRNDSLRARNEALHARVKELKEGREALEESARSQLGFIKDGEIFYRIVPEPKDD